MLSQKDYERIVREGGCIFELRGKVCHAAVALGKKHCPRHQAQLDALANRNSSPSNPSSSRRKP